MQQRFIFLYSFQKGFGRYTVLDVFQILVPLSLHLAFDLMAQCVCQNSSSNIFIPGGWRKRKGVWQQQCFKGSLLLHNTGAYILLGKIRFKVMSRQRRLRNVPNYKLEVLQLWKKRKWMQTCNQQPLPHILFGHFNYD